MTKNDHLSNKSASEKVRFSYALYGRKKGEGLLKSLKGPEVGKGAVLIPIIKQEEARTFFNQWDVEFKEKRIAVLS